jgi:von Willebrand factor type A domain-containing protein
MNRSFVLIVSFVGLIGLGLVAGCTWAQPKNVALDAAGGGSGTAGGVGGSRSTATGAGGSGIVVDAAPATPTTDANCGATRNTAMRVPPDLLLVFDRSGSMLEDPTTGNDCTPAATCPSKWNQATSAVNTAVTGSQTTIRWGLKLFSTNGNGCMVDPGVQVGTGFNTEPAIAAALAGARPSGSTPTTLAMTLAGDYLATLTTPNPRFIVLVTDGQPTCAGGDGDGDDSPAAVAAVAAQAARGYGTFVVGIATSSIAMADATLTQMSTAGMHPRVGTPNYYLVNNTAELVAALGKIGTQVGSCTFNLASPPPDPNNVVVLADGKIVPKAALPTDSGWTYGAAMTSVTLTGTYCQDVMSGVTTNVEALFGCGGITPIP